MCSVEPIALERDQYAKAQKRRSYPPSSDLLYLFAREARSNKAVFAITEVKLVVPCYYGVIYAERHHPCKLRGLLLATKRSVFQTPLFGGGQVTESENFCFRLSTLFLSSFSPPHSLPWPSLNPSLLK